MTENIKKCGIVKLINANIHSVPEIVHSILF